MSTHALAARLTAFVGPAFEGIWQRFCPGDRLPATVVGQQLFPGTRSALLHLLPQLYRLGYEELAGVPTRELVARELQRVRGKDCKTWWSLFVLRAIAAFGSDFDANPLLRDCDAAQRDELRQACDTTQVIDRETGELIGHPNNYWIVVAHCEALRLQLGLTDDGAIHDLAVANCRRVLQQNPLHYMDDSEEGRGRYDVYAGHGVEATCSIAALADLRQAYCAAWERVLLATARPDGGFLAWGRSGGIHAMASCLHGACSILAAGCAQEPERLAGVAQDCAAACMDTWWADDALSLHRHRRPHWYMGPGRLLENSFNHLMSLACAALELQAVPDQPIATATEDLYPSQDRFIAFDERGPGVWCYRDTDLALQLPLVDGFTSDYVAAPVWPGCFEQVCDRGFPSGVPMVQSQGKRWLPLRRPTDVVHEAGGLAWRTPCWSHLVDWDWWKGSEDLPGSRSVRLRIVDGGIEAEEEWGFGSLPESLCMFFAESEQPLTVEWSCDAPYRCSTVVVDGMQDFLSHTHRIRRLYQIEIDPATTIRLAWRLAPA